jgi:Sec-independent protein translocase protein TatA
MSKEKRNVEELLREIGGKIDDLIMEAKRSKDDIRDEIEEKIQELKQKKKSLEDDFQEYKNQEKWQEAKSHLSNALHELRLAVETVIQRAKNH